jgi:hypothetical protein
MKLYSISEITRIIGQENVYRYSPLKSLFYAGLYFLVTGVCSISAYQGEFMGYGRDVPTFIFYTLALFFGITAFIACSRYLKALKPCNWVVKQGMDRLLVKFRSYLNSHLPEEDPVVVEVPFSEIDWVRKTKETVSTETSDSAQTRFYTFLDIKLNAPYIEELKKAMQAERNRRPPIESLNRELFQARKHKKPEQEINLLKEKIRAEKLKHPKGGGRVTGISHHHPVRLTDNNIMRIDWRGLNPGIHHILSSLKDLISIEPEIKLTSDYTLGKSAQNVEDQILDQVERGNTMEAITLARMKYGFSLTEAKQFVENLRSK